jgi:hypothetical protein
VTDLRRRTGNRDGLEDLGAQLPGCHRDPGRPGHDRPKRARNITTFVSGSGSHMKPEP